MRLLKTKALIVLSAILLLSSCGWQSETPVIAQENTENVKLVLYLSDGDSDWKSVGETMLIDSGEILHVQRNKVRPDAKLITNDWNSVFQTAFKKLTHLGITPFRLDRKNGVVCTDSRCAKLYSICPSWADTSLGEKKCVSFSRD